jgi:hypothetical protein
MKKYRVEVADNGVIFWYKYGTNKLHREEGPAIVGPEYEAYYKDGKLHRENEYDGPALFDGLVEEWWVNGKRHRVDGPAHINADTGRKVYYVNGLKHREDGPAVECIDDHHEYWVNGKRHRVDGPAIECPDEGIEEYWLDGERMVSKYELDLRTKDECDGKIVEVEGRKYKLNLVG